MDASNLLFIIVYVIATTWAKKEGLEICFMPVLLKRLFPFL